MYAYNSTHFIFNLIFILNFNILQTIRVFYLINVVIKGLRA